LFHNYLTLPKNHPLSKERGGFCSITNDLKNLFPKSAGSKIIKVFTEKYGSLQNGVPKNAGSNNPGYKT